MVWLGEVMRGQISPPHTFINLAKIVIEKCNKKVMVYLYASPHKSENCLLLPLPHYFLSGPASESTANCDLLTLSSFISSFLSFSRPFLFVLFPSFVPLLSCPSLFFLRNLRILANVLVALQLPHYIIFRCLIKCVFSILF